MLSLFGVLKDLRGEIKIDGKPVKLTSPRQAKDRAHGIALVPEDRKTEGLMLPMAIGANMSLASLDKFTRGVVLDRQREGARIDEMVRRIQIKIGSLNDPVSSLSGGNQQKVVLAKWLATKPTVLVVDEPTRGIDVGTKAEVHRLMSSLAAEGVAVLMVSSELPEVLGMADRVLVMREGRLVAELSRSEATEESVMFAATGQEATL